MGEFSKFITLLIIAIDSNILIMKWHLCIGRIYRINIILGRKVSSIVTGWARTIYSSESHECTPGFYWGFVVAQSLVLCVLLQRLFVCPFLSFLSFYCLSFSDFRFLVTSLVSSTFCLEQPYHLFDLQIKMDISFINHITVFHTQLSNNEFRGITKRNGLLLVKKSKMKWFFFFFFFLNGIFFYFFLCEVCVFVLFFFK